MANKSFIKSGRFSEKILNEVEDYLRRIKFEERLEKSKVTAIEMKKILLEHLKKYFQGKISQEFVLALGDKIYDVWWEATGLEKDDILGTITCEIADFLYGSKSESSPRQIEKILRWAAEKLERDLGKRKNK